MTEILNASDYHRFIIQNPMLLNFATFQEVAYSINVSTRHKLIFFDVPKNASTYIKLMLQRLEFGSPTFEHSSHEDVHRREFSPMLRPFQVLDFRAAVQSTEYFKFTVRRDPVERLLSAYVEKVKTKALNLDAIYQALGVGPDAEISFAEFVYAVCNQKVVDMDPHWRVQFYQSFRNCIDGIQVYDMNNIPELVEDLSSHTGEDVTQYVPAEKMNVVSSAAQPQQYLTDELSRIIHAKYHADFDNR